LSRRLTLPVRIFGEEMFAGEGARALLTGLALHTDLSPDATGGAVIGWLLAMLGQQHGFPVPVGGAGQLTDSLVRRLEAAGGRVVCSAMVDRILVTAGRATGVRCIDGRSWKVRRAVLADVPAPALYGHLVDSGQLPQRLLADLGLFRWDDATLKLDWALSEPLSWHNPGLARAGTVHFGVGLGGCTRYAADLATGQLPVRPFVIAGQMTTADPSRSPEGTESLWAYTHLPQRAQWRDSALLRHVERVETALERLAPGFRDRIAGVHVTTPQRLSECNPSLVGGAINGGTAGPYQQLVFRPLPGLGRADTPIDRLYLASSSAHPGGGVHGACGANAARAALARDRPVLGRAYRAAIREGFRVTCSDIVRMPRRAAVIRSSQATAGRESSGQMPV
jgi:phytoene dehydrogenase-like protein